MCPDRSGLLVEITGDRAARCTGWCVDSVVRAPQILGEDKRQAIKAAGSSVFGREISSRVIYGCLCQWKLSGAVKMFNEGQRSDVIFARLERAEPQFLGSAAS